MTADRESNQLLKQFEMDEVEDEGAREEPPDQDAQTEPRPSRRHRGGLASIGKQMGLDEKYNHPFFESDEDERMVEILNSLECARMSLAVLGSELGAAQSDNQTTVPASRLQNLKLAINLSLPNDLPLEEYRSIGDWLATLQ